MDMAGKYTLKLVKGGTSIKSKVSLHDSTNITVHYVPDQEHIFNSR